MLCCLCKSIRNFFSLDTQSFTITWHKMNVHMVLLSFLLYRLSMYYTMFHAAANLNRITILVDDFS